MSNAELKQYPSGFLGSKDVPQTTANNLEDITSAFSQVLSRASSKPKSNHTSSVEVNSIWKEIISGNKETNTFEFKERIIRCALNVFGTKTFSQWLSAQAANPEFTKDHHRFIDETLMFIYENKPRAINLNNWYVILTSNKVEHTTTKYTPYQQNWLTKPNESYAFEDLYLNNVSKSIADFVHDWIKVDKGIDDLAGTLYIMFGIR